MYKFWLSNVEDLSADPAVDGLRFFWRLDNDPSDGSVHRVVHKTTRVDAQATVEVLKRRKINQMERPTRAGRATHPHVVFHVARHHQDVGNFINRRVLVQQAQIGRYFGRKQRIERLLMEQTVDEAAGLIGTSISDKREQAKQSFVRHSIKVFN